MFYFSGYLHAIPPLTISQLLWLDGGVHVIFTVIWCSDFGFSESEREPRKSDRHTYEQPLQRDWQINWILLFQMHNFVFKNSAKIHGALFELQISHTRKDVILNFFIMQFFSVSIYFSFCSIIHPAFLCCSLLLFYPLSISPSHRIKQSHGPAGTFHFTCTHCQSNVLMCSSQQFSY